MMRIYEVLPGRLLQSARTQTLTQEELEKLVKDYKITAVVNLWHTPDVRMAKLVEWYSHISFPDGKITAGMASAAGRLADQVMTEINKGGCVLIHCWGGRNRSGLISALALMRLQGITGAEAVKRVKAVRSGALVNVHFVEYLEKAHERRANPGDLGFG